MSENKIIHELSEEDLIAIAKGAKADTVMEKVTEAGKFIYANGIREGRTSISALLVFHTYKQWKGWDNKRQSKRYFFRDFNKYFKPHRTEDGMQYMLDARSFDTSQEEYWRMRADMRHEKSQKRKRTKTKT